MRTGHAAISAHHSNPKKPLPRVWPPQKPIVTQVLAPEVTTVLLGQHSLIPTVALILQAGSISRSLRADASRETSRKLKQSQGKKKRKRRTYLARLTMTCGRLFSTSMRQK